MSYTFNSVTDLQPPFDLLDEQIVDVPALHRFHIRNRYLKLLFFLHGEGLLRIDKNPPIPIASGDALLFADPCDQYYLSSDNTKPARFHAFRLLFSSSSIAKRRKKTPSAASAEDSLLRDLLVGVRHIPAAKIPEIQGIVATIRAETETKRFGYRIRLHALCMELCVLLARSLQKNDSPANSPQATQRFTIEKVKSYIVTNHQIPLTLDKIAWQAGWSGAHLARVFRHLTGESVFDYLNRVRITHAKNLLVSLPLPIGEVGQRAGFSSAAAFARSFKNAVGCSAREFRNAQRPGWVAEELDQHHESFIPGNPEKLSPINPG